MSNIKLNFNKRTIEVTKSFMKAASIYNSDQYKEFLAVQRDYPTFRIVESKGNSRSEYNDGLTYGYMENYIKSHDDENNSIMKDYLNLRGQSDEAQSANAKSMSYGEIKEWFLDKYPEIAKFHTDREDILKRVKENKKKQKATA